MAEKWVIELKNDKFFFTKMIDDKVIETYNGVYKETANVYAAAIINGFEPPRSLKQKN